MAKVNLYLYEPRKDVSRIYLYIHWNDKRIKMPTGLRIEPKHWSSNGQCVRRSLIESPELNEQLESIKAKALSSYRQFVHNNHREPSIDELRLVLQRNAESACEDDGTATNGPTFFGFIEQFIQQAHSRVNPDTGLKLAETTIKKYVSTFNHLKAFEQFRKKPVNFLDIDLDFYDSFNSFLTNHQQLALNSIGKYIQTVKTFLRSAEEDGITVNTAYRSRKFKTPSELTDKIYLTESELHEIFALDLSKKPGLERVRDLFIIGAWTGLRFGDFTSIRPEQITGDRIRIRTAKTGRPVVIPLHACVRAILTKYENKLPSAISNQKMNASLRQITAMVPSLEENFSVSSTVGGMRRYVTRAKAALVTTHTARRSFATNMYLRGVPARTIMTITGHTTEQAFRLYIRLNADEHADILQSFMERTEPLAVVA